MASLKERVSARVAGARERFVLLDHLIRTVQHYGKVNGNAQAGAVTYFGFLSFFPILALAFFVVGQVSIVYADAREDLVQVIDTFLPGIVGDGEGEIPLETFEQNAATIGLIGLVGLLYAGLGWLSAMRDALEVVFETPKREQPNFVVGKLRDLVSLTVIGVVLLFSVALSGLIAGFSQDVLDLVGLENTPVTAVLLWLVAHGLGIAATTFLFLAMYKLLADPHLPKRSMLYGAILGGIGFEILKSLSVFLIGITKNQPAFQAFGIALILLVWINYFSRVVVLSAAYAYTSPAAIEMRTHESMRAPGAAFGNHEEGGPPVVDARMDVDPAADADVGPQAPPAAPLRPAAPSPVVPVTEELDQRPSAARRADAGSGSRTSAGLVAAGAAATAGVAVIAWRRATR
jgi:membrane protein